MPYHHGNVRAAMLDAAVEALAEHGVASISLRELARRVGVTHAAARHHFGDKTGLLTAVASDGFHLLAEALGDAWLATQDFGRVGVAYVQFAVDHRAYFDVMFRPELYRADDPELRTARDLAGRVLFLAAGQVADAADGDETRAGVAAWAYVHGIATLWRDGNLPRQAGDDPVALTADLAPLLFQASKASRTSGKRGYVRGTRASS